jgi:hypothetical protein
MKHLLIILLTILFFFTGCEDKKPHTAQQTKQDTKILPAPKIPVKKELTKQAEKTIEQSIPSVKVAIEKTQAPMVQATHTEKNVTKLNRIGITIDNGIITIDTNKTKDFLGNLNAKMKSQIKKISDDLKKGIIDTKEAGIQINEKNIHIDLNKTKNLLDVWSKKIATFTKAFDTVIDNQENISNKGN